jgi:hypothetical protein
MALFPFSAHLKRPTTTTKIHSFRNLNSPSLLLRLSPEFNAQMIQVNLAYKKIFGHAEPALKKMWGESTDKVSSSVAACSCTRHF